MKNMIRILFPVVLIALMSAVTTDLYSQEKKIDTLVIKSSVVCGMCKDRVETGLAFEKGVRDVTVDLDEKTVTIKYNTRNTDPAELRRKLTLLGYDADEIPADVKAYDKLPACCKKDVPKH